MKYNVNGIPANCGETEAALFRSRIDRAYQELCRKTGFIPRIVIGPESAAEKTVEDNVQTPEKPPSTKAVIVEAREPSFSFEQLVLPEPVMSKIETAIQLLSVESKVFDEWGLRKIEPNPKTSLNFFGPPGTGKTMAAHAIASFLGKKIMIASYAEIESKYHGDGPKNVKALFNSAEGNNALLFIDEADSLLSKRLTNVTQGSEQAINSMRSQLLINLEMFHGIVIFSTNLVQNYDKAFETRIQHIEFSMPDFECRKKIWQNHLPPELPLAADVSIDRLAEIEDICGRDIRNAVIQSAVNAAIHNRIVDYQTLASQLDAIKKSRQKTSAPSGRELTEEEKLKLGNAIKKSLNKTSEEENEK